MSDIQTTANVAAPVDSSAPSRPVDYEDGWRLYRKMGSPKFVVAPMVDQSELPFRMLCRKYKADLAYTPMFHAGLFSTGATYREKHFTTCAEDRPLTVQFCANNPDTLLAAAKHVEDQCDAVDINLGCPQGIAKRGHYGSFLLEDVPLIVRLGMRNAMKLCWRCHLVLITVLRPVW